MKYVGADLHKQAVVLCVVIWEGSRRRVLERRRFDCAEAAAIREWFAALGAFQIAVEATSAYEWLVQGVEPLADRVVLVHPGRMRVIAESQRKTDKIDAFLLADYLAQDGLPEAWRPTPRVRGHRVLVRQRHHLRKRIRGVKCKLRQILAGYNADVKELFTTAGRAHLARVPLDEADRFAVDQLASELDFLSGQRAAADRQLAEFARHAPAGERTSRAVLASMPGVGPVTTDVVLSELGDVRRFRSQKRVVSFAGLAPGVRDSNGRRKDLNITRQGSRLLRWALVETAWRTIRRSPRWAACYQKLKARCGAKKAIVAIARRLLCVVVAMLRTGTRYNTAGDGCQSQPLAAHAEAVC